MTSLHSRNQKAIDGMLNAANACLRGRPARRHEPISVSRAAGVRGGPERSYNFGNTISKPAIVINGKAVFTDGTKPRYY